MATQIYPETSPGPMVLVPEMMPGSIFPSPMEMITAAPPEKAWKAFSKFITSPGLFPKLSQQKRTDRNIRGQIQTVQGDLLTVLDDNTLSEKEQKAKTIKKFRQNKDFLVGTPARDFRDGILYDLFSGVTSASELDLEPSLAIFSLYNLFFDRQKNRMNPTEKHFVAQRGCIFQHILGEALVVRTPEDFGKFMSTIANMGSFLSEATGVDKQEYKNKLKGCLDGAIGERVAGEILSIDLKKKLGVSEVEIGRGSIAKDTFRQVDGELYAGGAHRVSMGVKTRSSKQFHDKYFQEGRVFIGFHDSQRGDVHIFAPVQKVSFQDQRGNTYSIPHISVTYDFTGRPYTSSDAPPYMSEVYYGTVDSKLQRMINQTQIFDSELSTSLGNFMFQHRRYYTYTPFSNRPFVNNRPGGYKPNGTFIVLGLGELQSRYEAICRQKSTPGTLDFDTVGRYAVFMSQRIGDLRRLE